MKTEDFSQIRIDKIKQHRRKRNNKIRRKKIYGLDCETLQDGTIYLICDNKTSIWNPDPLQLLIVLGSYRYTRSLNLFYNIDFDFSVILKRIMHVIEDEDERNAKYEKICKGIKTNILNYQIQYIPGKHFAIRKNEKKRAWASFFDLAQFYGYRKLDTVAEEYLDKNKIEQDIHYNTLAEAEQDKEELIRYCKQDCKLTAGLGQHIAHLFEKLGIDFYGMPYSRAYLAQDYVIQHANIPTVRWSDDRECKIQGAYYNSYAGGRFECFQRGYFEKVYEYDINSAYPKIMTELPDFSKGIWHDYAADINLDKYEYGILYCHVKTNNNYIQPLWTRPAAGPITFKHISEKRWITVNECKFMLTHDMADIEIIKGYVWEPVGTIVYPLRKLMHELYSKRKELKAKKDDLQLVIKIIMNSIYGKMIQITKKYSEAADERFCDFQVLSMDEGVQAYDIEYKPGMLFNPLYASIITSETRLQLMSFVFEHNLEEDLVAFHTDSVITTQSIDKKYLNEDLGGWDLEVEGECVMLGSGVYAIKDDEKIINHWRGFTGRTYYLNDMPPERDDLFYLLRENGQDNKLSYTSVRPYKLRESVFLSDVEKIGMFTEFCKNCNVNFDVKRNWKHDFSTCSDVLDKTINSVSL